MDQNQVSISKLSKSLQDLQLNDGVDGDNVIHSGHSKSVQLEDVPRVTRRRKPTEKGLQYELNNINTQKSKLLKKISRKFIEADSLLYSFKNIDMVRDILSQVNDVFKMLLEINQKMINLDPNYTDEEWFEEIDEKVFTFKHQIHGWLKRAECEEASQCSKSVISKRSSRSSTTRISLKERAIDEKLRIAELEAQSAFYERKRKMDFETEALKREEELAILKARAIVYEKEDFGYEEENKSKCNMKVNDISKTNDQEPVPTAKVTIKQSSVIADAEANISDVLCKNSEDPDPEKTIAPAKLSMEVSSSRIANTQCNISDILSKFMREQSAPAIDLEPFDGNPLNFLYFKSMFKEAVEDKIDNQQGRLARLIKFTTGEARESIRHFVHDDVTTCYTKAMNLLEKQYGNPHIILATYRSQIKSMVPLKSGDGKGFRKFFNFVNKCCNLGSVKSLDNPEIICMLLSKLPLHVQDKWNRSVQRKRKHSPDEPTLQELCDFVYDEMLIITDPQFSRDAINQYVEKPTSRNVKGISSFITTSTKKEVFKPKSFNECLICKNNHSIEECPEYLSKSVEGRNKLIFKLRLCFGCLQKTSNTHNAKSCTSRKVCKTCNGKHPTTLHGISVNQKEVKSKDTSTNVDVLKCAAVDSGSGVVSMCVVPVELTHPNCDKIFNTYALLDSCSQGTFIDERLISHLGVSGRDTSITVKTLNGEHTGRSQVIDGLKVKAKDDSCCNWITLPPTFSKEELPVCSTDVASPEKLKKWRYLDEVSATLSNNDIINVGLLIGANCTSALEPVKVIKSQDGGPYGLKTKLGWCIVGPVSADYSNTVYCNRIAVSNIEGTSQHHFEIKNRVKENDIQDMFLKLYNNEFNESVYDNDNNKKDSNLSQNEKMFMQIVESNTNLVDGQYVIPLPFKHNKVILPDNRFQAEKRLINLKRKLQKNSQFKNDYFEFMQNLINKGYAKKSVSLNNNEDSSGWYIPHHGVYHPHKPNKIRVVFDLSSEFKGKSLNRELLAGPDLTNQIVGILLKFRTENVAVMGDIESMFYQVKVPEKQQKFLKFLWWDNSDINQDVCDYQMTVHVFGGTSSPSCANYALRKTATDNESIFGKDAANIVRNNFYVDDMLKSFPSIYDALEGIQKVQQLCAKGGFNLTKFTCNKREVLLQIPEEHRRKDLKDSDLAIGSIKDDKALGVVWKISDDALSFDINFPSVMKTKRQFLSALHSVYDPLGLGAAFLLKGKKIFQDTCKLQVKWDDILGQNILDEWCAWVDNVKFLSSVSLPRCYKPEDFGNVTDCSLHHFSDASELGYGQASYLRLVNQHGKVHCCLVFAKARVAPLKFVTIPRLELTAATLSVKIAKMLHKEIDIPIKTEFFWCDSQVVLGYIKSESRTFKTFVANRVQYIRDNSNPDQWHYVKTKNNPADDASRGLKSTDTLRIDRWFSGPEFLWKDKNHWPEQKEQYAVVLDDSELKKNVLVFTVSKVDTVLNRLQERCSDWYKMCRIMALVILSKDIWMKKKKLELKYNALKDMIDVQLLKRAQLLIFKMVQAECFPDVIRNVNADNHLKALNPFIDELGIIRVGGRLRRSNLNPDQMHPIVLPKKHQVTTLIVRSCHETVAHGGRGMTLNQLRGEGIWIVSANSVVRDFIFHCVGCRRLRGKLSEQQMADLPAKRCVESAPFTHCGVDMFGPFIVKERRSELKRYGAIFTCLSSRAVHIEVTHSLDTDSFIQALRRFIARRGKIRSILSDNGSNFLGADNELKKAFNEMNHSKIKSFLNQQESDWVPSWRYNPPAASHMGGIWERQIRSARNILNALLQTHSTCLNDENLHTLMTEVEAVINSRPLTVETLSDVNSLLPLSPSNVLTMKSEVVMPPPGSFDRPDLYCRRRWRRVQHIVNEFWSRWRKEFLSSLQQRKKWQVKKRNFCIGDVVLLKEDTGRNQWPMGRIVEIESDDEMMVRSVQLQLADTDGPKVLRRPISKLVLLLEADAL